MSGSDLPAGEGEFDEELSLERLLLRISLQLDSIEETLRLGFRQIEDSIERAIQTIDLGPIEADLRDLNSTVSWLGSLLQPDAEDDADLRAAPRARG